MEQLALIRSPGDVAKKSSGERDISELVDYQQARYRQSFALLKEFRSLLLTLHCGAGKTKLASFVVRDWPGRVLWLTHRDFLCTQARIELAATCKEYVDLEKAEWHAGDSRIVVASVQTLHKKRLERMDPSRFSLIVIDEGHHGTAKSWRAIPDWFSSAKVIYLSATPRRADNVGLNNVVDVACDPFGIEEGLAWGSFVPIVPRSEFIDDIRLDKVKSQNGDFALNELEEQIAAVAAQIAQLTVKHMGDRPTIIYTPGVASAHAVAATLRELGQTAVSVDADTEDAIRKKVLEDFRDGRVQYVVNCGIYTEGLDVPGARGIVIARPTKSESLYIQMAGRGGRPEGWIRKLGSSNDRISAIAASLKPNFLLLDITGHAGRHSLKSSADLLGGKRLSSAVEKAKERIANGQDGGKSLEEIFDEEEEKIKQKEEIDRKRVAAAAARAEVKSREGTFDPMASNDNHARGIEPENAPEPATPQQIEWLKKNGLPSKNMTRSAADKLYRQARQWAIDGRATWRHRRRLSEKGLDPDVSYECASRCMQALAHVNWQPNKNLLNTLAGYIKRDKEIHAKRATDSNG